MSYNGPERRSNEDLMHKIELQMERLASYIKSELGGDGTQGNIHYHLSELKNNIEEHRAASQKHWEKQDHILNGNGKPGLMSRLQELEIAHKNHQGNIRVIWIAVVGVVVTSAWKAFLSIVK